MFTHRFASSPPFCWSARFHSHRRTRIPTKIYDGMLLLLVILAVAHHSPGRGLLLAAFLMCRVIGRPLAHNWLTPSTPGPSAPGLPEYGRHR